MMHDVILIQSTDHMITRGEIIDQYFDIKQRVSVCIIFMKGSASDTLQILRLSKKETRGKGNSHESSQIVNIVRDAEETFFKKNRAPDALGEMITSIREQQRKEKKSRRTRCARKPHNVERF